MSAQSYRSMQRALPDFRICGFTLIELLVTLLIASLLIATVPPRFLGSIAASDTRAAAFKLQSALRHAHSQAIAKQRETNLVLDVEKRRYWEKPTGREFQLPRHLRLTLTTADSEIVQENVGAIGFYPDGSSTGGRINVADAKRSYVIDVDWLTGRIQLHD